MQCLQCRTYFEIDKHTNGKQKFCSKSCANKSRTNPLKRKVYICIWCGKEFDSWTYRNSKICSAQCRSEYGASKSRPKRRKSENFIELICNFCGEKYTVHKAQLEKSHPSKFCSRKCQYLSLSKNMMGQLNKLFRGGSLTAKAYGSNWGKIKREIRIRDCNQCQACGSKSCRLEVHHVVKLKTFDGDLEKANNHKNLILLCASCHKKVEHNKIKCPIPKS